MHFLLTTTENSVAIKQAGERQLLPTKGDSVVVKRMSSENRGLGASPYLATTSVALGKLIILSFKKIFGKVFGSNYSSPVHWTINRIKHKDLCKVSETLTHGGHPVSASFYYLV